MPYDNVKETAITQGLTQIMRRTTRSTAMLWPKIALRVPSTSESENYAWLNDVEGMKEFLGDRIFKELAASTYSVKNKTFEQSVGLDRHKVDDDNYGFYSNVAQAVAQKGARHPDNLMIDLVIDGENGTCYDGQAFYDTDHVEGESGTQSNLLTSAVADPAKVTVVEFSDAFHDALLHMYTFKTDKGDLVIEPLATGIMSENLKILVPLPLVKVANAAMTILLAQGGGTFDRLATAEIVPVTRMGSVMGGSDTMFDLLYTGDIMKPFVFQDRAPLTYQTKGAGDIENKLIKIMGEVRYNVGYGLWQHAIRTKFIPA